MRFFACAGLRRAHQRPYSSRVAGPWAVRKRRVISGSASSAATGSKSPSATRGCVKRTFWPSDGAKHSSPKKLAGFSSEPQLSLSFSPSWGDPLRSETAAASCSRVSGVPSDSTAPIVATSSSSSADDTPDGAMPSGLTEIVERRQSGLPERVLGRRQQVQRAAHRPCLDQAAAAPTARLPPARARFPPPAPPASARPTTSPARGRRTDARRRRTAPPRAPARPTPAAAPATPPPAPNSIPPRHPKRGQVLQSHMSRLTYPAK